MATITFDSLKFIAKPKVNDNSKDHAKAISVAFHDISREAYLVSKTELQLKLAPIRADINLINWILGILSSGVMALILKAYFPL
jgi:hypothetical protein